MNERITWVDPKMKIHAIRDIREATGYSLKDSKHAYEQVLAGRPAEVALVGYGDEVLANSQYVGSEPAADIATIPGVLKFIEGLPDDMTIGHMRAVLKALPR